MIYRQVAIRPFRREVVAQGIEALRQLRALELSTDHTLEIVDFVQQNSRS